jgi:Tol biopolymer transport system component
VATNLISGSVGDRNGGRDIYVHDRKTGITTLVSVSTTFPGQPPVRGQSDLPSISADGRYVAFGSAATDLIRPTDDPNDPVQDIFVRDLKENSTVQVTIQADGHSYQPDISDDGRYVAFSSDATNLAPGDGAFSRDVFVKDLESLVTTRITTADRTSGPPAISADGR